MGRVVALHVAVGLVDRSAVCVAMVFELRHVAGEEFADGVTLVLEALAFDFQDVNVQFCLS